MPLQHASRVGGETVYNEAPLRFRNLSVTEPELPTFGDLPGSQEGFKIRVARQPSRHKEAGRMVDQRYNGRGYKTPASSPSEADPNLSTFLAYDEGRMVGTVSVRLDSPNRSVGRQAVSGGTRRPAPCRAQALRIHAPRGRRQVGQQAGACRAVPHRVPVCVTPARLHARGDRGQPAPRRVLPAVAGIRGGRRRAHEHPRQRPAPCCWRCPSRASTKACTGPGAAMRPAGRARCCCTAFRAATNRACCSG